MAKKPAKAEPAGPAVFPPRIVLLAGPNHFLAAEHTAALRDKLTEKIGEIEVVSFDGTTANVADVLDECRSFGLMQTHKLIVVDNAEQLVKGDNRPLVERYAQGPAEQATLVLRAGGKWSKGKLDGMIEAVGEIKECGEVDIGIAHAWAVKRATKRHEATLERDAADLLIERVGADLGRLDSELGKLASAAATGKGPATITRDLVVELVGKTREEEVWDLQSTLLGHGPEAALRQLGAVLGVSRQPPQLVGFAYLDLARKLHGAAVGARKNENPWKLATALKLWGPSKDAILDAGKRLNPTDTARVLADAVESDWRQKTGQADPERALEILTVRITGLTSGPRPRTPR